MSTKFPPNPFLQRGVIHDPAHFFGRQTELHTIFDCIGKLQSVSVVGERRIGKSSLLHYVCSTGQGHLPPAARLIYLDVQRVRHEEDFYTRLLEKLGASGHTFRELENTIKGKSVVACLDEFEQVAGNEAFSVGFFDGMRSLAQGGLALVTATQHSLFDLCRDKKFAGSEFWNIFQRTTLGAFIETEARQFIQTRFGETGLSVSEQEILRVLQLAGGYPLFLQLACSCLFEMKIGRQAHWESAFESEAHDYLVTLWEHRTPQEQAALRWVLRLGAPTPKDSLLEELVRRGLLIRGDHQRDDWWIFSQAFEKIIHHPPSKPRKKWGTFQLKKFRVTLWPFSIEVEGEGNQVK